MCEDPYPDKKPEKPTHQLTSDSDTDFLDPPGFNSGEESYTQPKPIRRKIFSNEVGM